MLCLCAREVTFAAAILEATDQVMGIDPSVYLMGLGVPDPKGIFGTTLGLQKKYGQKRVMDMPTSENGMTGVAIGSAIRGLRPIMTHQRADFFLLAIDQLINNGAKWNEMFGGQMEVPIVIRLIIGRGWGQGPQHSQSLHSLFAHIPGIKVVMPATPYDAKGLLVSAVEDNHPVIYLEHRWLHGTFGPVPEELYRVPLGKARVVKEGTDVTIVTCSHMTLEARKAMGWLEEEGVSVEIVDLRSLRPLDSETVLSSVRKTRRVVVVDPDWRTCGFASEILALIAEELVFELKEAPIRITYPDRFVPTSWRLANHYYPSAKEIAAAILKMMGVPTKAKELLNLMVQDKMAYPQDVPDNTFTGPF